MKNRDIPLLQSILGVMQRIRQLEMKAEWEHDRMIKVTSHLSLVRGSGHDIGDMMDDVLAKVDAIEQEHREELKAYVDKMREADRIVNEDITDDKLRAFVEMAYIDGMSAGEVKKELNLSEWEYRQTKEKIENAGCMKEVTV